MDSFYSGIVEEQGFCGIGKTWQCILCDLAIKSEQERRNHSFNTGHRANVVETLELLGKKYDIGGGKMMLTRGTNALDLDSRADRLQSLNWKLQVQGVLYRFMKLDVVHSSTDTIYSLLGQAETLLQKFEQMERLSLLELAVWKAACISCAGRVEVAGMKTLDDAIMCVANNRHTWKQYRAETRKTNAIEIIIQRVLPFLGKP
jgi:hypothetical protein